MGSSRKTPKILEAKDPNKKLLILYHSQTGNTELLAKSCYEGAKLERVEIRIQKALQTTLQDVLWADGLLIGTPENFGYMSGALKDFFDRTYYPSRELGLIKPFALFVSCENDGRGAEREINKIATSYVLKPVLKSLIVRGTIEEKDLEKAKEMGQTFAAGLQLGIF